jgi:ADP-ribose pyrophosphatase YjhB (NUDIX family)
MIKDPRSLSPKEFFEKGHNYFLPNISIDCVIFGFHENQLKVLLLEWKDSSRWCLPGGFILNKEDVDEAAVRTLRMRTGLEKILLHQYHTFGDPNRERGKHGHTLPMGIKGKSWIMERFVTVGYWALVEYSKVNPTPDEFSKSCLWWEIDKVPELILDHNLILKKALESLRLQLNDYPIGFNLLSQKFTMPELQSLYETILGEKLDRRNFQKKIFALDIITRLNERKKGGAHKAPYFYKFDLKKYHRALKQGISFGI